MTLEEIKDLKLKIDDNLDALDARDLKVVAISDAFEVLIDREAGQSLIDVWLKTIDKEIESIVQALEELEEDILD